MFPFWAHDHQLPPQGDWRTWVVLGGRGAGKTRAGAEWVRAQVEGAKPHDQGQAYRIALMGETVEQVRDVMIFGDSGIMACSSPDRMPEWQASRKRLVWPSGASAQIMSAHSPESLRGPQFDAAWVDELGKWKKAEEAWDMLQFGLRLGPNPRQVVTTTPRNIAILRKILDAPSTVCTRAPTEANRAYLAASFLAEVRERYAGTSLERQELDGILLREIEGALWNRQILDQCRLRTLPELDRIVVAVDPPAGGGKRSDACGIVVAGLLQLPHDMQRQAIVLEDATVGKPSPTDWAKAVLGARDKYKASRIVAEINQGGAMVEALIRQLDPTAAYTAVRATTSKAARAEPIAALYEQGRVHHALNLDSLENQMCQMTREGFSGTGSPDRVDALVWALTALFWGDGTPTVRSL